MGLSSAGGHTHKYKWSCNPLFSIFYLSYDILKYCTVQVIAGLLTISSEKQQFHHDFFQQIGKTWPYGFHLSFKIQQIL